MRNDCSYSYLVFGLELRCNVPLPGLVGAEIRLPSSVVQVEFGVLPPASRHNQIEPARPLYVSEFLAPTGKPALHIWEESGGSILHLCYYDGTEFWVDRRGDRVWGLWSKNSSFDDAASYFLGPVLGLILRLRGATCLHASAVAVDELAVAFAGSAGAGKSTTAAAMSKCGVSVLSDDIVALCDRDDHFEVLPSYPFLSLWPESVRMLYGSEDLLPRFKPAWDKRCLAAGSQGLRFEERPLALGAVYILGSRQDGSGTRAETLTAEEALLSLLASSYATNVLDRDLRAKELHILSRLVETVPVRRILPSRELQEVDEICSIIRKDLQKYRGQVAVSS